MQKLGVFDSGIGGFNVVSEMRKHLSTDIVFLADHKNLPYGNKPKQIMEEILVSNLQWFLDKDIKRVLIACNTASTYIDFLREKFPTMILDSIIEITANDLKEHQDLLILGTNRTVSSKVYDLHLNNNPSYLALPSLANLVEDNDDLATKDYLKKVLTPIKDKKSILLACTHYSIVMDLFKEVTSVKIYDSINAILAYYKDFKGNSELEVYSSANIKVLEDQLLDIFNYDVIVKPMQKDYRIVVVSDNHGEYEPILKVLKDNKDAAAFIHCGDVLLHPNLVKDFYVVKGNNDFGYDYDDYDLQLEIGRLKVDVTHGDKHPRSNRVYKLYSDLKASGSDILCFGHQHIYQEIYKGDKLILNPGSLYFNRDLSQTSYAIIYVTNNDIKVTRVNI